jgi:hypothetical protein
MILGFGGMLVVGWCFWVRYFSLGGEGWLSVVFLCSVLRYVVWCCRCFWVVFCRFCGTYSVILKVEVYILVYYV